MNLPKPQYIKYKKKNIGSADSSYYQVKCDEHQITLIQKTETKQGEKPKKKCCCWPRWTFGNKQKQQTEKQKNKNQFQY